MGGIRTDKRWWQKNLYKVALVKSLFIGREILDKAVKRMWKTFGRPCEFGNTGCFENYGLPSPRHTAPPPFVRISFEILGMKLLSPFSSLKTKGLLGKLSSLGVAGGGASKTTNQVLVFGNAHVLTSVCLLVKLEN